MVSPVPWWVWVIAAWTVAATVAALVLGARIRFAEKQRLAQDTRKAPALRMEGGR